MDAAAGRARRSPRRLGAWLGHSCRGGEKKERGDYGYGIDLILGASRTG